MGKRIKSIDEGSEIYFKTLHEIKIIIAGMGSFTDLPMIPNSSSGLDVTEARIKQFYLAEELDHIIRQILNERFSF